MTLGIVGFALAATLLLAYRFRAPGARLPASPTQWSLFHLILASALTLFFFLRTSADPLGFPPKYASSLTSRIWPCCYVSLGFGLGCALARQSVRWRTAFTAFLGLILIVRLPWKGGQVMETLSRSLGAAQDVQIWGSALSRNWTAISPGGHPGHDSAVV